VAWSFEWHLKIERTQDEGEMHAQPWPTLLRWAIIGLAVLGVFAVLVVRGVIK
jgi:hypothetical protein